MENGSNVGEPRTLYTTTAKVLQYIEHMYTKWSHVDMGLPTIVPDSFRIISDSHLFTTIRCKETPDPQYRYMEFLDCIHLEFKGTSKLYQSIGCQASSIETAMQFQAAIQKMYQILIPRIVILIKDQLQKYYPAFKSSAGESIFNTHVDRYLSSKFIPIVDVENRKFVIVVKK